MYLYNRIQVLFLNITNLSALIFFLTTGYRNMVLTVCPQSIFHDFSLYMSNTRICSGYCCFVFRIILFCSHQSEWPRCVEAGKLYLVLIDIFVVCYII